MNNQSLNSLQLREVFHIEFLRWFGRKIKAHDYAVKGGTNLRFFYKSFRYSEDLDMDIRTVPRDKLKDTVMDILNSRSFSATMKTFSIEEVVAPDMLKAKQTETTQRFKVHLITAAGEDLFTKVEFSPVRFKGTPVVEAVVDAVLRPYKLAPLLVPHYDMPATVSQKVHALAQRAVTQARDIFDIYILSSQYEPAEQGEGGLAGITVNISKARQNIFMIGFEEFRDTVVAYLDEDDQGTYGRPVAWDEIRLKVDKFLEELTK